ncbi:unnamed protein product [Owenia fusiformis]|uniref:Uncharacterized protein n=1 Tax=Owenia fusiformis TaxID=6347 RepID=A0A8J1U076_OWEFU|nr:unnamed protein product [Owenia fusiformis]
MFANVQECLSSELFKFMTYLWETFSNLGVVSGMCCIKALINLDFKQITPSVGDNKGVPHGVEGGDISLAAVSALLVVDCAAVGGAQGMLGRVAGSCSMPLIWKS